jgi:hypothetical protein
MPSPYTVGETVVLTATFRDPDTQELFNPTGIVFKVMPPNSTMLEPMPTESTTGVWFVQQQVNTTGQWWWRVETSAPYSASERTFLVSASVFA